MDSMSSHNDPLPGPSTNSQMLPQYGVPHRQTAGVDDNELDFDDDDLDASILEEINHQETLYLSQFPPEDDYVQPKQPEARHAQVNSYGVQNNGNRGNASMLGGSGMAQKLGVHPNGKAMQPLSLIPGPTFTGIADGTDQLRQQLEAAQAELVKVKCISHHLFPTLHQIIIPRVQLQAQCTDLLKKEKALSEEKVRKDGEISFIRKRMQKVCRSIILSHSTPSRN